MQHLNVGEGTAHRRSEDVPSMQHWNVGEKQLIGGAKTGPSTIVQHVEMVAGT
jgi:hypothetical protein